MTLAGAVNREGTATTLTRAPLSGQGFGTAIQRKPGHVSDRDAEHDGRRRVVINSGAGALSGVRCMVRSDV